MSELIVIGYDSHDTAKQAYDAVLQAQGEFIVDLRGLAVVTVDQDGKTHVDTPQRSVGAGAATGALWGLLFGLLFFVPGLGLIGGAMGALLGKLNKSGVNDAFRAQVHDLVKPGKAAVVIMAAKITEDKFGRAIAPYGGQVLRTSLSDEDEKELSAELAG